MAPRGPRDRIVTEAHRRTAGRPVRPGCSAGAFPAVTRFTVTSAAPDALRERFAVGTSLRFVLEGDEIHVRSDDP